MKSEGQSWQRCGGGVRARRGQARHVGGRPQAVRGHWVSPPIPPSSFLCLTLFFFLLPSSFFFLVKGTVVQWLGRQRVRR